MTPFGKQLFIIFGRHADRVAVAASSARTRRRGGALKGLGALCIALVLSTAASAQKIEPRWETDQNSGCKLWNPNPAPGESVSWSGACREGHADGNGVEQWFKDGKPGNRIEGEFVSGRSKGRVTITYPDGAVYVGELDVAGNRAGDYCELILPNGARYSGACVKGEATGEKAEAFRKSALQIDEETLGPDHQDVPASLNNLARLYVSQGRFAEAEPLYKRALSIREKTLGLDHLSVATSLSNLAALYLSQGRYGEAILAAQRLLVIREEALGTEHPLVAESLNHLAILYWRQGLYTKVEPLFRRSLAISEKALGAEHPAVALALTGLAGLYSDQGRYAAAEPLFRRSLIIWEEAVGPEHFALSPSLNGLAILFLRQSRYKDAEPLFRRSLAILEKWLGGEHPSVAESLNNLAELYTGQGRYADAEPIYWRSLAIKEKALGLEHPDVALSLSNLAALYFHQGRYADAEPFFRRSLAIREKALGPEHPSVAESLNNLAELYTGQGRYADAEPIYWRSLAIKEKALGLEHPDVGTSLNNIANLYSKQGRYADSEPLLRRSLTIQEKALGLGHPDVGTSLNSLAELYSRQSRHADAEPLYRRSLAIWEKALGLEHPHVATSLNNLANLYLSQGRYAEAEPLYRRALAISEKALGSDHPDVAATLGNLANLYLRQGRYTDAEPLYKRALLIYEKAFGLDHPDVATSLGNLAELYRLQGRNDDAELFNQRAVAIYEIALGPDHPNVAIILNNIALVYQIQGRFNEAETLSRRSLAIWEKELGPNHPNVATSLNNIANLYSKQGRDGEAYRLAIRAERILEERVFATGGQDTAGRDSERWQAGLAFISFLGVASKYVGTAPDQTAAITAESFRAAQLATAADRTVALMSARGAAGTPALARIVRDRQDMIGRRNALEKLLIGAFSKPAAARDAKSEEQTRRDLADADRKLVEIDQVLRREFPSYAEIANPTPVDLPEAQKLLAPGEALVSFVVADNAIYRFIVRNDRAEFREIKFKSADLTLQIEKLRRGLDLGVDEGKTLPQFDAATAHELYKILFADSAPLLGGAKRLLIVPDAALTGLPFSVLLAKPATDPYDFRKLSWLVRDYAFSVLPSVGALKSLRVYATAGPPAPKPFIGFGDPILEGSPDAPANEVEKKQAMRGPVANVSDVRQLPRLPEATKELKDIAAALGGDSSALYFQGTATERQVKTLDLSDYRVIAFATHALTAGEFKGYAEPALVLTPPATGDETDDGLLSASEIMQLKLNADWVILSACNTAAADGTPGAPGLSGLAKAFFYAGAKALLVSHWSVQTTMAARLTSDTVRAQQRDPSLTKPEAIRRAMLAVLDDRWLPSQYRHPAFWAPFFVVGD